MFTNVGAEYAIKLLNGEVPTKHIDETQLVALMNIYIKEVVGEGVDVSIVSYSDNETTYENYKLVLMNYLDF
jgi:hypothetical protein